MIYGRKGPEMSAEVKFLLSWFSGHHEHIVLGYG
jgi:hypothetical protein